MSETENGLLSAAEQRAVDLRGEVALLRAQLRYLRILIDRAPLTPETRLAHLLAHDAAAVGDPHSERAYFVGYYQALLEAVRDELTETKATTARGGADYGATGTATLAEVKADAT